MIGELYAEMDNLDEAQKSFLQAVVLAEQIKSRPDLASIYHNLAGVYKRKGKINQARKYFRQAQEIYVSTDPGEYENIKKELLSLDNHE